MKLLGISGSLRKGSYNSALLRAAGDMLPGGVDWDIARIDGIPLYNADLDKPDAVAALEAAIADAHGVVFACPEYNYGIPGPLKNAIDWASRPAYQSVFAGKPCTLMGASPGPTGAARALGQLKQVLLGMAAEVYPAPELVLGRCAALFEESLSLTDPKARERLQQHLAGFVARLRAAQ